MAAGTPGRAGSYRNVASGERSASPSRAVPLALSFSVFSPKINLVQLTANVRWPLNHVVENADAASKDCRTECSQDKMFPDKMFPDKMFPDEMFPRPFSDGMFPDEMFPDKMFPDKMFPDKMFPWAKCYRTKFPQN